MHNVEQPILVVKDLETVFHTEQGTIKAVDGVGFAIYPQKTLGIVGESGCGKSVTALSIMRLLPQPHAMITGGEILFKGENLVTISKEKLPGIRGSRIAMIFQEPLTALNPVHKIVKQLAEVFLLHHDDLPASAIDDQMLQLLRRVGIADPERCLNDYPYQLSGGMRQRIMIAMALACQPDILIADEPTTALDVTIQAQILELMKSIQQDTGMAIIFITHDLGVIAELADDVCVMYSGQVVEQAPVRVLFQQPRHPYTKGLLQSIPKLDLKPKTFLKTIEGVVPSLFDLPKGCRFANRCQYATSKCQDDIPILEQVSYHTPRHSELSEESRPDPSTLAQGDDRHYVRCFHWKKIND